MKGYDETTGLITDSKLYERSRRAKKIWQLRKYRAEKGPYAPEPLFLHPYHHVPKAEVVRHGTS